jgi:hypothetical protein
MRRYLVALAIGCVLVGCQTRAPSKPNPPPPAPDDYTHVSSTSDGGVVACYGQTPKRLQGFMVPSSSAWTFG